MILGPKRRGSAFTKSQHFLRIFHLLSFAGRQPFIQTQVLSGSKCMTLSKMI